MPKYIGMTDHAQLRLHQRSSLSVDEINELIHYKIYITLGSKPGIQKVHLLIYSVKDSAWFVIVKDIINGDIITFLTEEYHNNLFEKIEQSAKDEIYTLTLAWQSSITTPVKRTAVNINIALGYVDASGYRKVKKIYAIPYSELTTRKENFFESSEYHDLKKRVLNGVQSGNIGNISVGKGIEPLFLKISFSKSDFVIVEL